MRNRPDITTIRKYLNGELDARAMYELERQAEDDPMLMDIIMGMESAEATVHHANLSAIHEQVQKRVQERARPEKRIIAWKSWGLAASILLAVTIAGLWILRPLEQEQYVSTPSDKPGPTSQPLEGAVPDKRAATFKADPAKPTAEDKPAVVRKKEQLAVVTTPTETARPEAERRALQEQDSQSQRLDEVVVVGYGTQKKVSVTGAVTKISADTIRNATGSIRIRGISTPNNNDINGQILYGEIKDAADNGPLAGAQVLLKNKQHQVTTDRNGRFVMVLNSTDRDTLQVRQVGYETKELDIAPKPGIDSLFIAMQPSEEELAEVVVTSERKTKQPRKAEPAIGWKAYKTYLKEQAARQKGSKGNMTLVFNLNTEGVPVNIRVLTREGNISDQDAIRIVSQGPTWLAGTKEGLEEEIKLTIRH